MQGRIKSFNDEKGFGFIENRELYDKYGRDVFIHRKQMGDLTEGTEITFKCDVNADGKPQARDVETMDGRSVGEDRDKGGKGKGKGKDKGKDGKGKGKGKDDKGKGKGKGDKGKDGKGKGKDKGKGYDKGGFGKTKATPVVVPPPC